MHAARPATRAMHYLGTSFGAVLLLLALVLAAPWLLLAAAIAGYGLAWAGHVLIEHNRPATTISRRIGEFRVSPLLD